ncbi:MAG: recombination mediator RecR [Verrucomicrobiota bacterium]|nr:recombination mediator RecR [Verrucomicrobiota bacterium]
MTAFERLLSALSRLPGIGRRSAERIAVRLARDRDGIMKELVEALEAARNSLCGCGLCGSVTPLDRNPCRLCSDPGRDSDALCVVEEPDDIALIERSGAFRGRYHALMGRISPMKGEGPADLRLRTLAQRLDREGFKEVILALSTDVEGDTTASFIMELLKGRPIRVTRLAFGLPAGSGIKYSDPLTLAKAIQGRQQA